MKAVFGTIPQEHHEQCARWYAQTAEDVEITAQVLDERLRPGDRVWTIVPPSLHVPRISPGDRFVQWVCDSGEGPPASCLVGAVFISKRRWCVYWTSGPHCWGATLVGDINLSYVERREPETQTSKPR